MTRDKTGSNFDRILVVDDTTANLQLLVNLLTEQGYAVHPASDGELALRFVQETLPDLILLDIRMPGMDGYEVCRRLKANERTRSIPVIFISVLEDVPDKVKGFDLGAVDYITKPIETEELLSRVSTHLTIRRLQEELVEANTRLEKKVSARTHELQTANVRLQQEISAHKQAEKALRKSEERYRTLFQGSADAIFIVRPEGEIVDVNPSGAELLGVPRSELVGSNILQYYWDPADRAAILAEVEEEGFISQREWKVKRQDGHHRICLLASSAWKDEQANTLAYLSIARDVTESKRLEERLRQAQKMEAIGTLAGGIAHDFNNLLFVITGNTELALDLEPHGSELHGLLHESLKASERAIDLVRQILAFSRQRTTQRTPISITPAVKEVVKFLRVSIPTTIEIEFHIDEDPGTIMADPTEVHQVLMNLCTNAAHCMRMHGGLLEVGLARVEVDHEFAVLHDNILPGPYAKLTISDTGHGISRENLERIFEPYFTTKARGEGTGLGLAVVHGIVRSYGGTISVYSELGKGTTFRVYLPVQVDTTATQAEMPPQALPTGLEKILVVDDEPPVTSIVKGILEFLGYRVTPVNDPREALDLFKARPEAFDLVITDMTMPKMTGIDLAQEFMSLRPDIPVILCTGFSELVNKEHAEKLGIRSFLMKPIRKTELAQTVHSVLHATQTPEQG